MKTMSLADAKALALRTGGQLQVAGKSFNSGGAVAAGRTPNKPIPVPAAPEPNPMLEALAAQAASFERALERIVDAVARPAQAPPIELEPPSPIQREAYTYSLEVQRDERTMRIQEVSVLRDGEPRYLALPKFDPSTGLIERFSITPIRPSWQNYQ